MLLGVFGFAGLVFFCYHQRASNLVYKRKDVSRYQNTQSPVMTSGVFGLTVPMMAREPFQSKPTDSPSKKRSWVFSDSA
jgi:hypothetical protein